MEDQNYTIKDIARMAGVSAGTVDRVLHNRGDVSSKSKAKVQKVLDEIHYQPNVFAIGLAAKKKYTFICLIPYYIEHDYWHSVVGGIERARQELRPFNVSVNYLCYHHGDKKSYQEACHTIRDSSVDAVLIAPNFREETIELTSYLQENKIAYAFVDFNMEEANALTYIGQDSYKSGYIAAKILMRNYSLGEGQELVLFLSNNKNNPAEIQMQRRLKGFMSYITEEYDNLTIHEVVLNKSNQENNRHCTKDNCTLTSKNHFLLGCSRQYLCIHGNFLCFFLFSFIMKHMSKSNHAGTRQEHHRYHFYNIADYRRVFKWCG